MSDGWQTALQLAWQKAGSPSFRELGRRTGINHETVRHAMNGSKAARRRTVEALAGVLCSPADAADIVLRWEGSEVAGTTPTLLPVEPDVHFLVIPANMHNVIEDVLAAYLLELHQVNELTWAAVPSREDD